MAWNIMLSEEYRIPYVDDLSSGVHGIRTALETVLPSTVVTAVANNTDCSKRLFPEERAAITGAKRRREYASVRVCAREAMDEIGVAPTAILNAADRSPVWPNGVVGSLTHNDDYCAAAVARKGQIVSVGIDLEQDAVLTEELWDSVCTVSELAWLHRHPVDLRGRLAKILFSAKESFFKCWYPVHHRFLEFQDVALSVDMQAGVFSVDLLRCDLGVHDVACWHGKIASSAGYLLTAVVLER